MEVFHDSHGVSLSIWDHTVLPATRHKWTHPALTPAIKAGTRFTYPAGMEGWVDLVDLIAPRQGVEPATFRSRVQRSTTAPPRQQCIVYAWCMRPIRLPGSTYLAKHGHCWIVFAQDKAMPFLFAQSRSCHIRPLWLQSSEDNEAHCRHDFMPSDEVWRRTHEAPQGWWWWRSHLEEQLFFYVVD